MTGRLEGEVAIVTGTEIVVDGAMTARCD